MRITTTTTFNFPAEEESVCIKRKLSVKNSTCHYPDGRSLYHFFIKLLLDLPKIMFKFGESDLLG